MTHYKLNRIILGVAAIYSIVIVAAAFFGPTSSNDEAELAEYTPGFADTVSESEDPTPYSGVGGVSGDEPAVQGIILDAETSEPLAGVSVEAADGGSIEAITTTGADGRFELSGVSDSVDVVFSLSGYTTVEQQLEPDDDYTIELQRPLLTGRVTSVNGSPIRGATVGSGDVFTRSVESGVFRLENAPEGADVVAKAAGYQTQVVSRDEFDSGFMLEPETTRAIYAPAGALADEARFTQLLDFIDRTDLNALVIDMKDHLGRVHYDSTVETAQEIGAVDSSFDISEVLNELENRNISAIARIVVFEDPTLAAVRPDLAIRDSLTGDLWRTWQGRAWANPYETGVWDYNVALIQEAAELGFDEVQLGSVQFPENGLINRADYGQASTAGRREQSLSDFLDQAYAAVAPTGARLTAEIFAMSLWDEENLETGQNLIKMTERVDYIHPLLFPSDFESGSLGYDSPGEHPYAMVGRSLESGSVFLPSHLEDRLRPWLQDFSYGSAMPFGEDEVRAQINAVEDFGSTGWMLWNPDGAYHAGSLEPVE